jgi:anhydro-N-acetylmuramic acid kinase
VQSIVASLQYLPEQPDAWYICGGGALNKHLMQQLTDELAPAQVQTTTDIGLPVEAVEAVAFALLAERTIQGKTNVLSEVTGAAHDVCAGQITPGVNWTH